MTPRFMRRSALLQHLQRMRTVARSMRSQQAMQSLPSLLDDAPEESRVCVLQGRDTLVLPHDRQRLVHSFLGQNFCQRAFAALTGVNPDRTAKIMKEGKVEVPKDTRPTRRSPRRQQIVDMIWVAASDLHSQSPFAKDTRASCQREFHMPFHHKICLWRLALQLWKYRQDGGSTPSMQSQPSMQSPPKYSLFRKVIVSPEFKCIVFHRVVDIGRCPKCEYFKWKMASVAVPLRGVWQDAFAKHHLLQIQQKRCYVADRARAAQDFPRTELYLAMDCGSGHEFVMPHLSARDREGPNKAIDGFATVPLKVCNGLVHGDTRGHVILSPGVVGATANHTCECLLIMINACFIEHKVLPRILTLQFDGASTNKCMLVLAFMALYVLEGVFDMARARCELENHAHDLYDAFQAIHACSVRNASYWHFEELRALIKAAHARHDTKAKCPEVGHDVMVSNLWSLRDFWEWLCPGYTDEKTRGHALANAAFTSYAGIRHLRDFKLQLEAGSTDDNPSVGLWAKPYMTSKEYTYLGTLLSRKSVDIVTRNRPPPQQCREVSSQKTTRETKVLKHFHSLTRGQYADQFSPEKLADAIAFCERDWQHFKDSEGELGPEWKRLPHELAAELRSQRSVPSSSSSSSVQSTSLQSDGRSKAERAVAAYHLDDDPDTVNKKVKQKQHVATEMYGIKRGPQIPVVASSARAPTDKEFAQRRVAPGTFVITRPAPSSHWARSSPLLSKLDFWLWQVVNVYSPGDTLPSTGKKASDFVYTANLFRPEKGTKVDSKWKVAWQTAGPKFMYTDDEKENRKHKLGVKFKMSPKQVKAVQQARRSKQKSLKQSKQSVQSKQSQPSLPPASSGSSFSDLMKSWEASAKKAKKQGEVVEKLQAPKTDNKAPMQSFLRPANIVGGGFGRTSTGMVPRFVRSYWDRQQAITA